MIAGYPARPGVAPGERLVLHVSTDAARFRAVFFRWDGEPVRVAESGWLPGVHALQRAPDEDWQWPSYEFPIPAGWPSAVYIAWLDAGQGAPDLTVPALTDAAALFVVRGPGRSPLLYKLPIATYQAYNWSGGGCFYVNPPRNANRDEPPGARLSLRRPGAGVGGPTWGADDHYDTTSPRQTFAHWDARFIRWLQHEGHAPEFCTDFDIHDDPSLPRRYRMLVSAGHDEYWSGTMRDAVEGFVAGGGNVAFFCANLCWWRIHVVDGGAAIVCHQGGPRGALDHWWPPTGANRPEDSLGGVSYRHGGGWWDGPRETAGYVVQAPDHWAFAGTGLRCGDTLGRTTSPPAVGYECDGAPLAAFDPATGIAVLDPEAARHGTPASFRLLAVSPLGNDWQERPPRAGLPADAGLHAAVMGAFTHNGTVFSAGSTDWVQALCDDGPGADPRIAIVTRNVMRRMLA